MALKFKDYLQIINTFLMLVIGAVILLQAFKKCLPWNIYILGVLFAGFGIYRAMFVYKYFMRRQ